MFAMKRANIAAVVLFAVLAACMGGTSSTRTHADTVRDAEFVVMTFNIRYGTADDGDDAWPHRSEHVLDVIHATAPAILGVQEALDFQIDWLAAGLPGYVRLGQGREGGSRGEHASLFVESARFEVLSSGDFWLSEQPDVEASVGWDAALTRLCTWARLRAVDSGREMTVWNTHFDHRGAQARVRSAELIAQRVRATEGPNIVLGDLNAGETSAPLDRLTAAGLRDSFRALHPDRRDVGTFHAFRGGLDGDKIDHILATPELTPLAAEILSAPASNGRWPSDHHPVTATFAWSRDERGTR